MESLRLLKYLRGGGAAAAAAPPAPATIATTVLRPSSETDDDNVDGEDEGPFFDLEFAVPEEEGHEERGREMKVGSETEDSDGDERDFDFGLSSEGSAGGQQDGGGNLSLSPSDDLFFKGRLLPLESSLLFSTPSVPHTKAQFSASLLKPATKFRVFMLRFKKPKSTPTEANGATAAAASPKQSQPQKQGNLFVKFKVEEVPLVSLFTRDNSSRSSSSSGRTASKPQVDDSTPPSPEEKKFSKEMLQRYLSKIKPLYVRVSKRYTDRVRFSGQLDPRGPAPKPVPRSPAPQGSKVMPEATISGAKNLPAGLRVVRRRLGKSRSASSTVVAVPSPPRRRDDSLLQQQDGIQSAIAHCKRSFNSEKGMESPLTRSNSEPGITRSEKSSVL